MPTLKSYWKEILAFKNIFVTENIHFKSKINVLKVKKKQSEKKFNVTTVITIDTDYHKSNRH